MSFSMYISSCSQMLLERFLSCRIPSISQVLLVRPNPAHSFTSTSSRGFQASQDIPLPLANFSHSVQNPSITPSLPGTHGTPAAFMVVFGIGFVSHAINHFWQTCSNKFDRRALHTIFENLAFSDRESISWDVWHPHLLFPLPP